MSLINHVSQASADFLCGLSHISCIELAKEGSSEHLLAVVKNVDKIPFNLHGSIVKVFFSHLQRQHDTLEEKHFTLASFSFIGLGQLSPSIFTRDRAAAELLTETWADIFSWIQLLYDFIANDLPTSQIFLSTFFLSSLQGLIFSIRVCSDRPATLIDRKLLEFLFRLWCRPDLGGKLDLVTSCLAGCLDDYLSTVDYRFYDFMTSQARPRLIAKLAISRLREAANRFPLCSADIVASNATILLLLAKSTDRDFADAVTQIRGIPTAIETVLALSDKLNTSLDAESFRCISQKLFLFMLTLLDQAPDSVKLTHSAFRHGLFEAYAKFCLYADSDHECGDLHCTHPMHLLTDVLPRHLVYGSVISVAQHAMHRLYAEDPDMILSTAFTETSQESWNIFCEDLLSRFVALVLCNRRRRIQQCGNSKCRRIDYRSTFGKCAGCDGLAYCSSNCQAIAWKTQNHKLICGTLERCQKSGIDFRDYMFIQNLAEIEIERHMPGLRKLAARDFPNVPFESARIAFGLDFTTFPATLSVLPTAEFVDTGLLRRLEKDKTTVLFVMVPTDGESASNDDSKQITVFRNVDRSVRVSMLGENFQASLDAGERAGGGMREGYATTDDEILETRYDEVDEIIRRLHGESVRQVRPVFDEELIRQVIDGYLDEIRL
ncbi:hypothetical protein DFH11DRAFT_539641 [Phellopilus nigrolimitatus]|nr:hypothetical protein DFH11DRAFT_539641 [Phellopilus nigrolimitatus]